MDSEYQSSYSWGPPLNLADKDFCLVYLFPYIYGGQRFL